MNHYLKDIQRKRQHGKGICSVFILDTSESMAGEGGRQMKMAMSAILNGKLSFWLKLFLVFQYKTYIISVHVEYNLHVTTLVHDIKTPRKHSFAE